MRTKSPTNCDAHLAESLFQTRSRACLKNHSWMSSGTFIVNYFSAFLIRAFHFCTISGFIFTFLRS
ncbi:DUF6783 domain-containing protein [Blautia acetigignens]|uniref:DUF6783 domain-containing protein n=1 Tax=Blautia acetigignens TaxID=2981783 RepID=A0ABV1CIB3_9FIRM